MASPDEAARFSSTRHGPYVAASTQAPGSKRVDPGHTVSRHGWSAYVLRKGRWVGMTEGNATTECTAKFRKMLPGPLLPHHNGTVDCDRCSSKCFAYVNPISSSRQPYKAHTMLPFRLCRWKTWGTERLRNFSEVAQRIIVYVRIPT